MPPRFEIHVVRLANHYQKEESQRKISNAALYLPDSIPLDISSPNTLLEAERGSDSQTSRVLEYEYSGSDQYPGEHLISKQQTRFRPKKR